MTKNTMRCFIIGEDNLHIECAKILKEQGHTVLGVVSSHEPAKEWAINNEVAYYSSLAIAAEQLLNTSF